MNWKIEKIGRNDPCPCGSGKKYKKCCLGKLSVSSTDNEDLLGLDDLENDPEYQKVCQEIDELDSEWHDEHPGLSGHKCKCDFCDKRMDADTIYTKTQTIYSNLGNQTINSKFCSNDCKIADDIAENLVFMGFSSDIIRHLRGEHGLTKDEIKAGVDRIFERGDDLLCGALINWEDSY